MKKCGHCQEDLSLDKFNKKKDSLQSWCKDCNRERSRAYYASNREQHKALISSRNKKYKKIIRDYIISIKESTPCSDCNKYYPAPIMDFDHLRDKTKAISEMANRATSLDKIKEEIAKCEIVCANCHRYRTFKIDNPLVTHNK